MASTASRTRATATSGAPEPEPAERPERRSPAADEAAAEERPRGPVAFLKDLAANVARDDLPILSGALAFFTALSLSPLLVLALWVGGRLGFDAQRTIVEQVDTLIGGPSAEAVATLMENAREAGATGGLAGSFGVLVLLYSASKVFAHLQRSMNRIWDVRAATEGRKERVVQWLRKRALSFAMVATIGFLLLVSLVASAAVSLATAEVSSRLPLGDAVWIAVNEVLSFALFTVLFGAIFKFLPDVRIAWRDVWTGAALTSLLFCLGKHLIGLYVGRSTLSSSYGAAGTLVVVLLWTYYSSLVLFLGAEVTQTWARRRGSGIHPSRHATWEGTSRS